MEFGKTMDISAFDWDDTALIKEYDRIMKTTKKALSKSKENKGATSKEKHSDENEEKPWTVGDYCRAVYHDDGLVYEATIVDIYGDTCTVEFLGYGDLEEVALDSLLESNGKKARQKQRKRAKAETENCASDNEVSEASERREASKVMKPPPQHFNQNPAAYQWDYYAGQSTQPYQPPHPAPVFPHTSVPPLPTACVQRIGDSAPYPPPPAPPMPPCSAVTRDPALSAMLVSWYMAGYYTGLHQNQKSSHCSAAPKPRCCDHHQHAVPNCCDHPFF